MSKNQFPGWYYGPNGEARVIESADAVPKGWKNRPWKVAGGAEEQESEKPKRQRRTRKKKEAAPDIVPEFETRDEVLEYLKGRGIVVAHDISDEELQQILDSL